MVAPAPDLVVVAVVAEVNSIKVRPGGAPGVVAKAGACVVTRAGVGAVSGTGAIGVIDGVALLGDGIGVGRIGVGTGIG